MVETFIEELKIRGIIKYESNSRLIAMGAIAIQDGLLIGEVVGLSRQETRNAFVDTIQAIFSGLVVGKPYPSNPSTVRRRSTVSIEWIYAVVKISAVKP